MNPSIARQNKARSGDYALLLSKYMLKSDFPIYFLNQSVLTLAVNMGRLSSTALIAGPTSDTPRSSVGAYTLLQRVLIHADCKWPSTTPFHHPPPV